MVAKIILDTNIVSYLMKRHSSGQKYLPHLLGNLLAISFITVGELYVGAEKDKWGERKRLHLQATLKNYVVIPYDDDIAKEYARIVVNRLRLGKPISFSDAWISACAVRHDVPLVTHNAKHFESIPGLRIITEP